MDDLSWLQNRRFQTAVRYEHGWTFLFDRQTSVSVGCFWRLLENGRICVTSCDDGHRFGRPEPVDAQKEINGRLVGTLIERIDLLAATLDLSLHFETGHILQMVADSSGYEAWNLHCGFVQWVAGGGGELAKFTSQSAEE